MTKTTKTVHEINLRKFCALGGIIHIDLLEQPPQPRDLGGKYIITVCEYMYGGKVNSKVLYLWFCIQVDTPPGLNPVSYYEHYVPPPPPEPGTRRTPEEIEVEVKKQEEALEKLASVTIT